MLSIELGEYGSLIAIERLPGRLSFRAPEFSIAIEASSLWLRTMVVQGLIEASRLLGATQFTFEHSGFPMRRQPTDLPPDKIERLLIASHSFEPFQINIY